MRLRTLLSISLLLLLTARASFAQWVDDGLPICTADQYQYEPKIISDGAGGVLMAWWDTRDGDGDVYVQRVDGFGHPLWTPDGVPLYVGLGSQQELVMVSDGAGGAIVVWGDNRDVAINKSDVYCRRIDANGVPLWNANAVALCVQPENQLTVKAVADGSGGAIVVWRDFRNGVDYDVYAQRVNAAGDTQWTANGLAIATEVRDQNVPGLVSDGTGGAIFAWSDGRVNGNVDIYTQRVTGAGVPQWTEDGVPLCTATGTQRNAELVSDFQGGAIVTWWDARGGTFDIYSQRVSPSGVPQWTADGVAVCTAANDQISAVVAASGNGGVLISWLDMRNGSDYDAYVQLVNGAGVPKWTADGVKLCNAPEHQAVHAIGNDGSGGAVVAWGDGRNNGGIEWNHDMYVRRISNTGDLMWAADGVLLCDATLEQQDAELVSDGSGGAFVAWVDNRAGQYDVYVQRVLSNGAVPITTTAVTSRTPVLRVGDVFPNPFSSSASFELELAERERVHVEIFDVAGRAVRAMSLAGSTHRVTLDGRNDDGRPLPSGVYFCRVRVAGETITRKMVIAR